MAAFKDLDLSGPLAFIDSCVDPYPALCGVIFTLFGSVKISIDDKQDILADISDALDGIEPSKRSGFVPKDLAVSRKKRKG